MVVGNSSVVCNNMVSVFLLLLVWLEVSTLLSVFKEVGCTEEGMNGSIFCDSELLLTDDGSANTICTS